MMRRRESLRRVGKDAIETAEASSALYWRRPHQSTAACSLESCGSVVISQNIKSLKGSNSN